MARRVVTAVLVAVACLTIGACGTAYDVPQPWCTIQALTSSQQCFYRTREECMTTLSGMGGICVPNPDTTGSTRRARKRSVR